MRKFCAAVKTAAVLLLVFAAGGFAYMLSRSPVFERGRGYELYLGTSSSASVLFPEDPVLAKLQCGDVAGESVRYDGNRTAELLERFRAVVLFCEETEDAVNYYCYSPLLGACVNLRGETVNLHIAAGRGQTAAGTPVIFGGF